MSTNQFDHKSTTRQPTGKSLDLHKNRWTKEYRPSPMCMMFLCPQCVNQTNKRDSIKLSNGNYFLTYVVCQKCLETNKAIIDSVTKACQYSQKYIEKVIESK